MRIEPMRLEDLDDVLAIERDSFTNPWSRQAFAYELRDNRVAGLWVARAPDDASRPRVVAYLCLWLIGEEVHVTNFAVHPTLRHRGIGRHLLSTLLEHYRQQGATRAALEVRVSNDEARRLYEGFGFRQIGRRKGYYFDTGEDALVMEALLAGAGPLSWSGAAGNSRAS
ncbi:MAG: ribosomal protein S18-alanine N-acetyltransferase [Candidatus Rokuibacteriota bacterium]